MNDIDQVSSQETDYSETTPSPYLSIEMDHALLQYPAIPEVGIHFAPPKNKFKYNDYGLEYDSWFGYDSDNQYMIFLDAVSGEEDYDDDKDLPGSMVGGFRDVNDTRDEAGKLLFFSNSEI